MFRDTSFNGELGRRELRFSILNSSAVACILALSLIPWRTIHGQESLSPARGGDQPTNSADSLSRLPSSTYEKILAPLDETRSNLDNWSPIERSALDIAQKQASEACTDLEREAREGEELLSLARLCALGQSWAGVHSAATAYLSEATAPNRLEGYRLEIQAELNLGRFKAAVDSLEMMSASLPFSSPEDEIFDYLIRSLQIVRPDAAVRAALLRQPFLLRCLNDSTTCVTREKIENEAWQLMFLLKWAGDLKEEGTQKVLLVQALTAETSQNVGMLSTQAQRRYQLLGTSIPLSLRSLLPEINFSARPQLIIIDSDDALAHSVPTSLLKALDNRAAAKVRISLLQIKPRQNKTNVLASSSPPPTARSEKISEELGVSRFPVFLAIDRHGRITFVGSGTKAWLEPGREADEIVRRLTNAPNH